MPPSGHACPWELWRLFSTFLPPPQLGVKNSCSRVCCLTWKLLVYLEASGKFRSLFLPFPFTSPE